MTVRRIIGTPLGEFGSYKEAAAALHCDRNTVKDRIARSVEGYSCREWRVQEVQNLPLIRGVRWPIPWSQYRWQSDDDREAIYQAWCRSRGQDPDLESTALAFFDEMDLVPPTEDAAQEDAQDESDV